jgi:hypothetical protein
MVLLMAVKQRISRIVRSKFNLGFRLRGDEHDIFENAANPLPLCDLVLARLQRGV